jgi:hypothetical protein
MDGGKEEHQLSLTWAMMAAVIFLHGVFPSKYYHE